MYVRHADAVLTFCREKERGGRVHIFFLFSFSPTRTYTLPQKIKLVSSLSFIFLSLFQFNCVSTAELKGILMGVIHCIELQQERPVSSASSVACNILSFFCTFFLWGKVRETKISFNWIARYFDTRKKQLNKVGKPATGYRGGNQEWMS